MMASLRKAMVLGLLRPLDVHFASMIAHKQSPALQLAAAILSRDTGAGHVCLPLYRLQPAYLFDGYPELTHELWQAAGEPGQDRWIELLNSSLAVGTGIEPTPLVLQQDRLYLHRMWQNEGIVAQFFGNGRLEAVDERCLRAVLDKFFGVSLEPDWQKIAAAIAVTSKISLISGGPGTGKTTTVAKLLAALVQLASGTLRILLAAPTGKAAARLTQSLNVASRLLPLTQQERALFPDQAVTLHRLLGMQPNSQRLRYHRASPLNLDVLVVDEAAMVDLTMMARLIEALPADARVILLGDRDQLASVEAGAVFGDICRFIEWGYSIEREEQLTRLTGCALQGQVQNRRADSFAAACCKRSIQIPDSLCLLRTSWRFDEQSGIAGLALAVNAGDSKAALKVLRGEFHDVTRHPLAADEDYQVLLRTSIEEYQRYLARMNAGADPAEVLVAFGHYQLLCALREGPFGVNGLNERIVRALQSKGLISRARQYGKWYAGRPVMISRNNSALGLFNGDIGMTLFDADGCLKVWFLLPDGSVKSVQPGRLPEHETAWAMTVHKSQGSEFSHAALVLPNYIAPIVTRELVYTAVTRARARLTVYTSEQVFIHAIRTPTQRRSGVVDRVTNSL